MDQTGPLSAAESRFVELPEASGGVQVHYKQVGGGALNIVLLHGLGGTLQFWKEQVSPLVELGQVVAVDLPGHGESDKPEITYDHDLLVRAVGAVLAELEIETAVFIGHSMGEMVMRRLYARHPEQMVAYISIDGLVYDEPFHWSYRIVRALVRTPMYGLVWGAFVAQMLGNLSPELREWVRDTMMSTPRHVVQDLVDAILMVEDTDQMPINVPVLAVNAGRFTYAAPELTGKTQSIAPLSERVVIEDVGHYVHLEAPDRVNTLIMEFIVERVSLGNA